MSKKRLISQYQQQCQERMEQGAGADNEDEDDEIHTPVLSGLLAPIEEEPDTSAVPDAATLALTAVAERDAAAAELRSAEQRLAEATAEKKKQTSEAVRLRDAGQRAGALTAMKLMEKAGKEVETLQAEVPRLREALAEKERAVTASGAEEAPKATAAAPKPAQAPQQTSKDMLPELFAMYDTDGNKHWGFQEFCVLAKDLGNPADAGTWAGMCDAVSATPDPGLNLSNVVEIYEMMGSNVAMELAIARKAKEKRALVEEARKKKEAGDIPGAKAIIPQAKVVGEELAELQTKYKEWMEEAAAAGSPNEAIPEAPPQPPPTASTTIPQAPAAKPPPVADAVPQQAVPAASAAASTPSPEHQEIAALKKQAAALLKAGDKAGAREKLVEVKRIEQKLATNATAAVGAQKPPLQQGYAGGSSSSGADFRKSAEWAKMQPSERYARLVEMAKKEMVAGNKQQAAALVQEAKTYKT